MYTLVPIGCRDTASATAEENVASRFQIVMEIDSTF